MRVRTIVAAVAFWVIGAWLRLYGLPAMEFKADERISLELGIQLLADHPWSSSAPWPSHGLISSNGVGNAPLFIWIVAPLWAMTHHPVGVAALIAVVNALTLIPLWFWAQRKMDERRALLVLAIASVSPFAVLFSRKIWPVDLLLPSLLTLLWSLEWWNEGRQWRAIAAAALGALLVMQLHQSGLITIPLLVLAIAIQLAVDARRENRSRTMVNRFQRPSVIELVAIASVVAATVFLWWTYVPYLRTVPASVFDNRPREPTVTPQLLLNVFSEIAPRHVLDSFFDERNLFRADPLHAVLYYGAGFMGIPLALYGIWRWLRQPAVIAVFGIWWWLVILTFALARIPSHDYYVLAIQPLVWLLAAGAFDGPTATRWARALSWWRWTYVGVLLTLTVVTGAWLLGRGGSRSDYGVAFNIQEVQARSILDRLAGRPHILAVNVGEVDYDDSLSMPCRPATAELAWLARWMNPSAEFDAKQFQLCDGWIETGHDAAYHWRIRDIR